MSYFKIIRFLAFSLALFVSLNQVGQAGVIKDIYQKITNSNNKTESTIKESVPVCGSGIFSTPDERSLSPEIIFITNRASDSQQERRRENENYRNNSNNYQDQVSEVAREFRFHAENVTLADLEERGFNSEAPVTFLMHGFTSGYPLQAWISGIVEAYTIDRQVDSPSTSGNSNQYSESERRRDPSSASRSLVDHNLFIVNWNYAARGAIYPRAVANIPIVASCVTRFINQKLLDEARVDPRRVQLIGHSLGAHLAGFIGKNTRSKVGRIYGLDPAGPCFGAISGPLYPSSKRLAPGDADEVITIQTNSALLGIDKAIGKYSVFVEGGAVQPGCQGGGVLKSISTLTWDGGDFDTIACSHSRAPNLLTYRHGQGDSQDECQLVAYECQDWDSFKAGKCGVCGSSSTGERSNGGPLRPLECVRLGLEWQYPGKNGQSEGPSMFSSHSSGSFNHFDHSHDQRHSSSNSEWQDSSINYRRPKQQNRRAARNLTTLATERRRSDEESVQAKSMFLRTTDTQPFCTYHYQIVLTLKEPFTSRNAETMSIILQDSEPEYAGSRRSSKQRRGNQNSLQNDQFGHKYDDRTYTHLITSSGKLGRIDHATLLFRNRLPEGERVLRELYINYMSHSDPQVRQRLSSRLCLARNLNVDRDGDRNNIRGVRFYFEPCDGQSGGGQVNDNNSNGNGYNNNGRDHDYSRDHDRDHDYGNHSNQREQNDGENSSYSRENSSTRGPKYGERNSNQQQQPQLGQLSSSSSFSQQNNRYRNKTAGYYN